MPSLKPYNGGQWTQARFNSFIKSALRKASMKWPPIHRVRKKAWVKRGNYKCVGYGRRSHVVPVSFQLSDAKAKKKTRHNNIFVDHIHPIVDVGSDTNSWDDIIKRMFVEEEDLQVLCKTCHDKKTKDEREKRNESTS